MGRIMNPEYRMLYEEQESAEVEHPLPVEAKIADIPATEIVPEELKTEAVDKKVYLAQDIQNILGIGRTRCYSYLEEVYKEQKPFRVIKIGKLFRVPKQSFDNWLNGCG